MSRTKLIFRRFSVSCFVGLLDGLLANMSYLVARSLMRDGSVIERLRQPSVRMSATTRFTLGCTVCSSMPQYQRKAVKARCLRPRFHATARSLSWSGQPGPNFAEQPLHIDRLGIEVGTPDLHAFVAIAGQGVGRQRNDRDCRRGWIGLDQQGRFPAVHLAQRDVHQDKIRHLARGHRNACRAVVSTTNREAVTLQAPRQHFPVDLIVFNKQDFMHWPLTAFDWQGNVGSVAGTRVAEANASPFCRPVSSGIRIVKRLPFPTSLSTKISPPISLQSF